MAQSDFLAIILLASGSSHARGPDKEDCIKRVGQILVDDWSSLFDCGGQEADVGVYDVIGHDKLYWDHRGVWVDNPNGDDFTIPILEVRKITLPMPRKR